MRRNLTKDLGLMCDPAEKRLYPSIWRAWRNMIQRCHGQHQMSTYYAMAGVCLEWRDFNLFRIWCVHNNWRPFLDVHRVDPSQEYSPVNCKLVTHKYNMRHSMRSLMITWRGHTRPLARWCEIQGLPYHRTYNRLYCNRVRYTVEQALTNID